MSRKIFGLLGVVLFIGMGIAGLFLPREEGRPNPFGGAPDVFIIDSPWTTNTSTSIGVGATQVLATNTGRIYARLTNDSDTAIYLNLSGASSTLTAYSVRVNANGGTYDIGPTNLYTGIVYASTTAASKKLLILEK